MGEEDEPDRNPGNRERPSHSTVLRLGQTKLAEETKLERGIKELRQFMAYAESATVRVSVAPCPARRVEHLPSLTPLRGIATLSVVLFPFCWRFPHLHPGDYGIVREGYLVVDVFFVLSGFVISHVYKDIFASECTCRGYCDFLKARIARIYPLHLAMLMVFLAAVALERAAIRLTGGHVGPVPLTGERSVAGLFANLAMLQGLWARGLSWDNPAWSISLEFIAYLPFPLLFPWLWRGRGRAARRWPGSLPLSCSRVLPGAPGMISTSGTIFPRSCAVCPNFSSGSSSTASTTGVCSPGCWRPISRSASS
jgi:peptidoglycan/LPS O-acetylase OafA/YrhL